MTTKSCKLTRKLHKATTAAQKSKTHDKVATVTCKINRKRCKTTATTLKMKHNNLKETQ